MAGAAPAPAPAPVTQTTSHVSATTRSISLPSGLVPVALLLATAAGLVSLLPSLAQAVWEVPHLFVLCLVIAYGVFSQRNTDADATGHGAKDGGGALAWNAQYYPDDPLVVVGDHAASGSAREGAMERPLSLPVRRLKPPAMQESDTGDVAHEETDSSASSSGFWAGARAAPSPPSVLDTGSGLFPCSQPQSPPCFAHGAAAKSTGFSGNHPCTPRDEMLSEDGEITDGWDEEVHDASDEMTVSSEMSSPRGDDAFTAPANDQTDGDSDDDDGETSVDEELLKLAPKTEDEVNRKADEFIAKFRERIRRQRL